MAQAGGALVSALVVATCTAFLCAVVLIGLLALVQSAFFGRRRESRKPFRDVDAVTSGHQLEQQTQCPPAAPSGLPISHVGGTLQPFVVVHELHVGEMWLAKLLQVAAGPSAQPARLRPRSPPTPPRLLRAGADRRTRAGRAGQGRQGAEGCAGVALGGDERGPCACAAAASCPGTSAGTPAGPPLRAC